jgi:hypothetical protein
MKKQILSAFVATVLLTENSYAAAGFFDGMLENSLMNVTPSGTIVEKDSSGNIKNTTFYTTSVYFRFGSGGQYPTPLINVSPPKMSVGCNGLSIKGMFASLIGLDQLESQLKNAGASLAWGIVVGLIYSLPGIGAAFRMIDTWSKAIQKLLANACQSGIAIGEMLGGEGLKNNAISKKLNEWDADLAKAMQTPKVLEGELLGLKFNTDTMSLESKKVNPSKETISDNWRDLLIGAIASNSISTNVLSSALAAMPSNDAKKFFANAWGVGTNLALITPFSYSKITISLDGTDSPGIMTGTNGVNAKYSIKTLLSGISDQVKKEDIGRSFTQAAISRTLVGDITITDSSFSSQLSAIKKLTDSNATMTDAELTQATQVVNGLTEPGGKSPFGYTDDTSSSTPLTIATQLVKYLLTGATYFTGTPDIGIRALSYYIIALPGKETDGPGALTFIIAAAPVQDSSGINWFKTSTTDKGAKERSKIIIDGLTMPGSTSSLTDLENSSGIDLLIPGIINKIKIIQQSPANERDGLRNVLIDFNAYYSVIGAIDGFNSGSSFAAPLSPVFSLKSGNVTKETTDISIRPEFALLYAGITAKSSERLNKFVESQKYILNLNQNIKSAIELNKQFDEQNTRNINSAIKVAPGK